jgi:hypothetical protein
VSYEVVTLRDTMPGCCCVRPTKAQTSAVGVEPIATLGLIGPGAGFAAAGLISNLFGSQGPTPAQMAYNLLPKLQAKVAATTSGSSTPADAALTRAAFAARGVGTALNRVMSRAFPGKVSPSFAPQPPAVTLTPVVATPVPVGAGVSAMDVPASMTAGGDIATGAGAESTPDAAPAAPASGFSAAPFIIGGLLIFAMTRRHRANR